MNSLRSYHNWLALPALIIIVFCFFSGFSSDTKPQSIEDQLLQRTKIMQECMEGIASYSETEKKLIRLETQPLLSEDVKNLKNSENSSFDKVHKMNIVSVENKRNILGNSTYEIKIKWNVDKVFKPKLDEEKKEFLYKGWQKAVRRSLKWEEE